MNITPNPIRRLTVKAARLLFLLLLALPFFPRQAAARETPTHFVVCFNNGERIAYPLSGNPAVTIVPYYYYTLTCGGETVRFDETPRRFFFGVGTNEPDGIGEVETNEKDALSYTAGSLEFSGFRPGTVVAVYASDGRIVKHAVIGENGEKSLPIHDLTPGTYIVKAGNQSLKIIKQ